MTISTRTIDDLKSEGHLFAAGVLAHALGNGRHYGCHFGFRSTREADAADFLAGWDAAEQRRVRSITKYYADVEREEGWA